MRKQGYRTDPSRKEFGFVQDFSGGLNTVSANDNMGDNELTHLENMTFDERGSLTRRTGLSLHKPAPHRDVQTPQLFFRHSKTQADFDEIVVVDGRFFINGVEHTVDGVSFQTERMMEAVQWYQTTYIATGTKLIQWDGTELKVVEPHKPEPLMALYVGTNALAEDPDAFIADGTGATVQLNGVKFSERYGVMNQEFTMTVFSTKPAGTTIEYKFEYRFPFMPDGTYHLGRDWSENNVYTHKAEGEGTMQFRILARKKGEQLSSAQYYVPQYTIKPAVDPDDLNPPQDEGGIHSCNRILLHWERLILYGDTVNVNTIYISHLKYANYFPFPNTLFFETTKTEPLNALVKFRDSIIAFTDTSIQALYGKGPSDYRRVVLNTSLGCIAPRGACVMDNYVAFVSPEGLYYLKSVGYVDDKANVAPLAEKIDNMIPKNDRSAVLTMYQGHLYLGYPEQSKRFRYHKGLSAWGMDTSEYLDVVSSLVHDNELYHLRKDGMIVKEDENVWKDLEVDYTCKMVTRYMDFNMPYHIKKMKELQFTARSSEVGHVATVRAYLDGEGKNPEPIEWETDLQNPQDFNMFIDKKRVSGKCIRMKLECVMEKPIFFQILGFGLIHKLKKP